MPSTDDNGRSPIYEKLDSKRKQIRLIQVTSPKASSAIQCKMQTFDLRKAPLYQALSYAWGPVEGQQQILINGHELLVRRNLYDFLQVFWKHKCRDMIWIDQLCINQSSIEEKNQQVGIMEFIYKGALETFIWLGPDPDFGLAFEAMRQNSADGLVSTENQQECTGMIEQSRNDALEAMLSVPYWTRHWVAQEIAFSRSRHVLYGMSKTYWENLSSAAELFEDHPTPANHLLDFALPHFDQDELRLWCDVTNFARDSLCQDPKDKIFGIQNSFKLDLRIEVNYTRSVEEVYMATIACWYTNVFSHYSSDADWENILSGCCWLAHGMGFAKGLTSRYFQENVMQSFHLLRPPLALSGSEEGCAIAWKDLGLILCKHLLYSPEKFATINLEKVIDFERLYRV